MLSSFTELAIPYAAFSAYPADNYQYFGRTTTATHRVIFNHVNTVPLNAGGHYNPENSVFICPINGYYVFVFDITVMEFNEVSFDVIIDASLYLYKYRGRRFC